MTNKVVVWSAAVLVALVLALMGAMKFMNAEMAGAQFIGWGYPAGFALLVGTAELLAAGLLLAPRAQFYGGLLAGVVMVGAIGTHLRVPEMGLIPLAAVILAGAATVAWSRRPRGAGETAPSVAQAGGP